MALNSLRIDHGIDRGEPFEFDVDGETIQAYPGETIAAALLAAGKYALRVTARLGSPRGLFCGMGVCHDCRMTVDGWRGVRTCMTAAQPGCRVRSQTCLDVPEQT
jgi:sarcosine oxidase subunit alpha